VNNLILAS